MRSRQWWSSFLLVVACLSNGCTSSPPVLPVSLITVNGPHSAVFSHTPSRCFMGNHSPPLFPIFSPTVARNMAERVHQEIVKNSTYPMLARQYGWQGTVQLCLVLERDGTFSRVTVETSSGNAFLDNEAVRLVRSVQITDIPSSETWTQLTAQIPITYDLMPLSPRQRALIQAVKEEVLKHREYPVEAIASKLEGNIVAGATVGPDGSLQHIEVYQSSGSGILDDAGKTLLERSAPFPMLAWEFDSPVLLLIPVAYRFDHTSP